MEKLLYMTKRLSAGDTDRLEYYLLTEPDAERALDSYGIEIVRCSDGETERSSCRNITPLGGKAVELLTVLAEAAVQPCHLHEVLGDLLA